MRIATKIRFTAKAVIKFRILFISFCSSLNLVWQNL